MGKWRSRSCPPAQRWLVSQRLRRCARRSLARRAASGLALLVFLTLGGVSKATVDLTGDWYVAFSFPDAPDVALLSVVQTDTLLQMDGLQGTIDPSTGRFDFQLFPCPFNSLCPFCELRGQASMDGNTFAGEGYSAFPSPDCHSPTCACGVTFLVGPFYGSRSPCGDGVIEPGEACDDANLGRDGDCCMLGCSFAPAGQGCATDGIPCTTDICNATGTCTHPVAPDGASCSDGRFCNGAELCQDGVCEAGAARCPLLCDEANQRCVTSCPAPQSCRTPDRSRLLVKDRADEGNDRLTWKWMSSAQTAQTEFGDPTATADYALCIYAGTAAALVGEAIVPASASNWSVLSTTGYKYRDAAAAEGGITKVLLKRSARNMSEVVVKGTGALLPDLPLPISAPVTVQILNGDNGLCWGASYNDAQLLKNETGRLKAKTP